MPVSHTPQPTYEWRIHPHTGVRYQVEVHAAEPASQPNQLNTPYTRPSQSLGQPQQSPFPRQQYQQVVSPDITAGPSHDRSHQVPQSTTQLQGQSNSSVLTSHERVAGIVSLLEGAVGVSPGRFLKLLSVQRGVQLGGQSRPHSVT